MKLRAMATVLLALLLITATDGAGKRSQKSAMDLYCERDNCYDVLGVESKATKSEIKRAFRSISKQHHPDMKSKDPNSPTIFQAAANAYEILTDEEARENYDYYIAHPEEHMANQFRYYRQAAKKINVVPVLIMLLIVITIIKYLSDQFRYDSAVTNWKAWDNVQVRAKKEALKVLGPPKKSQKRTGHSKKAVQEAMDKWMTNQIESGNIQGLPSEPALKNLFIVHLVIFPYTLYQKVVWYHGFRRCVSFFYYYYLFRYDLRSTIYDQRPTIYDQRSTINCNFFFCTQATP